MANNSYGWAQPQTQPAIPINTRYAPKAQTAQVDTLGSPQSGAMAQQQADMYRQQQSQRQSQNQAQMQMASQGPPNFQGGGFGGYPGGPTNPPMTGMGTPPQGPQNATPPSLSGAYQPTSSMYGGADGTNLLQQLNNGGWNLNNPATWQGQAKDNLESFMGNYFAPITNAQNAAETQKFNEYNAQQTLAEQQRVNTGQMGLAQQGQDLQQAGFNFASGPQFQQAIAQFNAQQGLAQQTQNQNYQLGQGQNAYNAANVANQYSLGQQANKNTAQQNQQQYALGNQANQNTAQNNQWNYNLGQTANANTAQNNAWNYGLGQQQNANQLTNYNQQYALGQGQNQNAATANANQLQLGQGQLGYQNRQLDTTNSFNRDQLAQDATLAYAKNANDLTQARYAAFGRAQAPSSRAALSWY